MRKKRFLSLVLSAAMVMSSSVVAFGANTGGNMDDTAKKASLLGKGSVEGYVDKDVFTVKVPTNVKHGQLDALDFILDPQKLIEATSGNKYVSSNTGKNKGITGVSNNDYGTLYFTNLLSGNKVVLSTNSDPLTFTNKGAVSVNVALKASVTDAAGIVVSNNDTLTDTQTSMFLKLVDEDDVATLISANGGEASRVVSASDSAYSVSYNQSADKYDYVASANSSFPTTDFYLTGGANENANWKALAETSAAPAIEVVWDITPVIAGAPSIAVKNYNITRGSSVAINVDLGTGSHAATGIARVMNIDASPSPVEIAASNYTFANGTLTLTSAFIDNLMNNDSITERNLRVIFDDAASTKVVIKLRK